MDPLNELTQQFTKFPGIGPRQARRFVHYLLHSAPSTAQQLSSAISELHTLVSQCEHCYTFYKKNTTSNRNLCTICANPHTDKTSMMIITSDSDHETVTHSHVYSGRYFIFGATIPILHKNKSAIGARPKELFNEIKRAIKEDGLKEVIFGFACNPDGEHTETYVRTLLAPFIDTGHIKTSTLGRGISTGTELEYIDEKTLKNALSNRK